MNPTICSLAKVGPRYARVGPEQYTQLFARWQRYAQGGPEHAQDNKPNDLLVGKGRPKIGPRNPHKKHNDLLVGKGRTKEGLSRPRARDPMICSVARVDPR